MWNNQTQTELTLDGPVGQVYAMAVSNDVLFAGTQVYIMKTLRFLFLFFLDQECIDRFQVFEQ